MFALFRTAVGFHETAYGPKYTTRFERVGRYPTLGQCRAAARAAGPGSYEVHGTAGRHRAKKVTEIEVLERVAPLPAPLARSVRAVCHN